MCDTQSERGASERENEILEKSNEQHEKQTENEKFNWIHLFNDIEQNFVCIILKFI